MWSVRDPVSLKGRPIYSRLLCLNELERGDLSCAHPLSTAQKSRRSRTLDDLAEQAAGESDEGVQSHKDSACTISPYLAQDVIENG